MLPAVSADLPAYLVPPNRGGGDKATTVQQSSFGPPARVDLSADQVVEQQSRSPGTGLYGPDGRFVDSAAQRELSREPRGGNPAAFEVAAEAIGGPPISDTQAADAAPPSADSKPAAARPAVSSAEADEGLRDLRLTDLDAIIPPAFRAELNALAERVARGADLRNLPSRDLKQIAALMSRVGRYDEAHRAMSAAEEFEEADQDEEMQKASTVLAAVQEQMTEPPAEAGEPEA